MENTMEEKMFQKLMDKILEFEKTHEKVENASKKELLDYYLLLYRITAGDEEEILVDRTEDRVVVRIQAQEILFLKDVPALKQLIGIADDMFVRPDKKGVEMELNYRLWDWVESNGD